MVLWVDLLALVDDVLPELERCLWRVAPALTHHGVVHSAAWLVWLTSALIPAAGTLRRLRRQAQPENMMMASTHQYCPGLFPRNLCSIRQSPSVERHSSMHAVSFCLHWQSRFHLARLDASRGIAPTMGHDPECTYWFDLEALSAKYNPYTQNNRPGMTSNKHPRID